MRLYLACLTVLVLARLSTGQTPASMPASAPTSRPAGEPTTQASAAPDLCMSAIEPYLSGAERMKFFQAAGADNELDEKEFTADAARPMGFVRKFDKWAAMLRFDKNANKTIDWFEADAYRQNVAGRVLAAYDANKDLQLTGEERKAANLSLAAGNVPGDAGGIGRALVATTTSPAEASGEATSRPVAPNPRAQAYVKNLLARYDENDDGKLDANEMTAMHTERFAAMNEQRKAFELQHFDANGDGQLNEQEKAELKKFKDDMNKFGEKLRNRMFDADGDGQVSDQERQAGMNMMMAVGARMQQAMQKLRDADGDGQISEVESAAYGERAQKGIMRLMDEYVRAYDADGNGRLDAQERDGFIKGFQDEFEARIRAYDSAGTGRLNAEDWVNLSVDFMTETSTTADEDDD